MPATTLLACIDRVGEWFVKLYAESVCDRVAINSSSMREGMLQKLIDTARRLRRMCGTRRRRSRIAAISAVLLNPVPPDTSRAEADFEFLQKRYPPVPEYGYDLSSLFVRAAERAITLHRCANSVDKRLEILEVGAGDGMLGMLLAAAGHEMTVCDLSDWRINSAKHLNFIAADCCVSIPLKPNRFDLVCSYNSFEHFSEPGQAFEEILRVTRPGGLIRLEFGPLYCSGLGLHAYRSLRMRFPQFLFSDQFIKAKLSEIGIWDLGQKRSELQHVNRWKLRQFMHLWERPDCRIVDRSCYETDFGLDLIEQYPEAFRGRGLTFEDIVIQSISITICKVS